MKELFGKLVYGSVAQLGERSVRIREVDGSIPFRSTILSDQKICQELYPADFRRIKLF